MSKRLKLAVLTLVAVFAAAQLIRPKRINPPIDASRTIRAVLGSGSGVAAVTDRSCRDCHSNGTEWRWYTQIAPLSWLMARGVAEGRRAVNFSEWASYPPDRQRALLAASCQAVSNGKMPGFYTVVRPETRLSAQDIRTICDAAQVTTTATKDR